MTGDALAIMEDFAPASWQRAADLILAACGSYPHDLALR
jgi:hypothetical protein